MNIFDLPIMAVTFPENRRLIILAIYLIGSLCLLASSIFKGKALNRHFRFLVGTAASFVLIHSLFMGRILFYQNSNAALSKLESWKSFTGGACLGLLLAVFIFCIGGGSRRAQPDLTLKTNES